MVEKAGIYFTKEELDALQQILHQKQTIREILNKEAGFAFERAREKIDVASRDLTGAKP